MKKIILLALVTLILTGCTIVRIDKYYVPRGVTYIVSSGSNDKLYSNGVYYYLYLDEISYYYKKSVEYKVDNNKYYSRKIDNDGKIGYLEITKQDNLYLIEFVYNYARIEALVPKEDINDTVLNSSYILSTIKYNSNIIKLSLEDDFLKNKEEEYNVFSSKNNESDNSFLRYEEK